MVEALATPAVATPSNKIILSIIFFSLSLEQDQALKLGGMDGNDYQIRVNGR